MNLRLLSRSLTLLAIIPVIGLVLIGGCSRNDNITSETSSKPGPLISVSVNRPAEQSETASVIGIRVQVSGGDAGIERIIYTISGQTSQTDTLQYSPPIMEISEVVHVPGEIGLDLDSSLTLKIIAIDDHGADARYVHSFNPIDMQPPVISIDYDVHGYAPRDIVTVHVTASDNKGLYYIAFSTAGAFAWNDTLRFEKPYPTEIDTIISIPIPIPSYLGFNFWITAEAVDANFNSTMVSGEDNISIVFGNSPVVEVHPIGGSNWVRRGDSLRFWVVGYNNPPLTCLGYSLQYGRNEVWFTIDLRDSISGEFDVIDSAYFEYLVPDTCYFSNIVNVKPFAYANSGPHYGANSYIMVEDRIRFSQATIFKTPYPENSYVLLHVDDRRDLVYVGGMYQRRINIYSQTSQQFLDPIDVPFRFTMLCLSADTNSILVSHLLDSAISIIDIDESVPHVDTTIALPGFPSVIATLSDGTALIKLAFWEDPWLLLHLDLTNYTMDTIDIGMGGPAEIAVSGNSEYALIHTFESPNHRLIMYQSGIGVVFTQLINWSVSYLTCNRDGSRFIVGLWNGGKTAGVLDNNFILIDSITGGPFNPYAPGVFSRDNRNYYFQAYQALTHVNTEDWSTEHIYLLWPPHFEMSNLCWSETNAAGDRLFMTGQRGLEAFYFFDIPIDPR